MARKNKILIVENDHTSYIYYKEVITTTTGAIIFWAQNGKQGVDIFTTEKDIDIIIMDIEMPIMNGYEASAAIKKISPNTPIVILTAYAMRSVKEKAELLNCDSFLTKPIRAKDLLNVVLKYLTIE